MVQMVHVQAVGNHLPALPGAGLEQAGVAQRHRCIDRHRGADLVLCQRLHDAKNTHPVAVVAQGVVAQVGVGRHHGARRFEGHALHVQREPLQRRHHPQRHAGVARPLHGFALGQHGPVVVAVVHAVAAQRVLQVVVRQARFDGLGGGAHGLSPAGCAAAAKASK